MTEQENSIPIKGYATFDPLKHCMIGSGFKTEWFQDLSIYKNNKIMDALKKIAEETEEDYQSLEKILNSQTNSPILRNFNFNHQKSHICQKYENDQLAVHARELLFKLIC